MRHHRGEPSGFEKRGQSFPKEWVRVILRALRRIVHILISLRYRQRSCDNLRLVQVDSA